VEEIYCKLSANVCTRFIFYLKRYSHVIDISTLEFHITVYILLSLDYPLVKHLMNISCLRVLSSNYTLYQVCEFLHLILDNIIVPQTTVKHLMFENSSSNSKVPYVWEFTHPIAKHRIIISRIEFPHPKAKHFTSLSYLVFPCPIGLKPNNYNYDIPLPVTTIML
jgi:hypothetical protein